MNRPADTYSLLLTPAGAGAIAVIRVVGPDAVRITAQVFRPKGPTSITDSTEGCLRYGQILDGDEVIDDVIASRLTHADQPAVEICPHGGVRVVERILSLLERFGAPFCEEQIAALQIWSPCNAIEAEALEAIATAHTERALRFAAFQRRHLTAHLQDLAQQCLTAPQDAVSEVERLLRGLAAAKTLLRGWTAAIIGPPNSGKSTLFNQFAGRKRAVVSPQAGTTRDWIEEEIEIEGLPIRLVDTAGRHEAADHLEHEAIRAGTDILRTADLLILLLDQSAPLRVNLQPPAGPATVIIAANKSDLPPAWDWPDSPVKSEHRVRLSAAQGSGVAELARLVVRVSRIDDLDRNRPFIFTDRQRLTLEAARLALLSGDGTNARNIIQQQLTAAKSDLPLS